MNVDIRLKVTWASNMKRKKLQRILGAAGPLAFIDLLIYTAMNRPTGNLTDMDEADIEIAAQWDGEKGKFVETLLDLNFLEKREKFFALHEWKEHNAYAANAPKRSKHASDAAKVRHKRDAQDDIGQCGEQKGAVRGARVEHTPTPTPTPTPIPSPKDKDPAPEVADVIKGNKAVKIWIDVMRELRDSTYKIPPGRATGTISNIFKFLENDIVEFEKRTRNYLGSEFVKKPTPTKFFDSIENYKDNIDPEWENRGG